MFDRRRDGNVIILVRIYEMVVDEMFRDLDDIEIGDLLLVWQVLRRVGRLGRRVDGDVVGMVGICHDGRVYESE